MTDLQDRLTRVAPDVDTEAALTGVQDRARRISRRRRVVVGGAAAVVVAAGAIGAVALDRADSGRDHVADSPAEIDGEWTDLAEPPFGQQFVEEGRVWTGAEVVVIGHRGSSNSGGTSWGAAYDPDENQWRTIARSPLSARDDPVVAWTGDELVVWGGDPLAFAGYEETGAAYDPEADSWRMIATAPIEGRGVAHSASVGDELVIVGGRRVDGAPRCTGGACSGLPTERLQRDGAAYDPATDSWRRIADMPVVLGEYAATTAADGELRIFNPLRSLAYDIVTDKWRELSLLRTDGPRLRQLVSMSAAAGTAIAHDSSFSMVGEMRPQSDAFFVYRPDLDRWEPAPRSLSRAPQGDRCSMSITGVDDRLLVAGCVHAVVDPASGTWTPIDPPSFGTEVRIRLAEDGVGGNGAAFLVVAGFSVTTPPVRPEDHLVAPGFVSYRFPEG